MALMTKSIGISTPLILSIVVAVAPRLISRRNQDQIVSYYRTKDKAARSYHIGDGD